MNKVSISCVRVNTLKTIKNEQKLNHFLLRETANVKVKIVPPSVYATL